MLEISRYLVAAQLGSAWGETEREGRMYRHYVLHQSHTLALAERRKDVSATFGIKRQETASTCKM